MINQTTLLYVVIAVAVIARFLVRELRERTLGNAQLFALPVVIWFVALLAIGSALFVAPQRVNQLTLETIVMIPIGLIVGLLVAHFTTVRILSDGRTRFRGSYATVAIWVVAFLMRIAIRVGSGPPSPGQSLVLNAVSLALIATALTAVRYFVWRKAQDERRRNVVVAETAV